jgi:hypothetical protein
LISIRIPLEIKKAATPRSQDPEPSVVRDRCHANFSEKALFIKPTWGFLVAAEGEAGALRGSGLFGVSNKIPIDIKSVKASVVRP